MKPFREFLIEGPALSKAEKKKTIQEIFKERGLEDLYESSMGRVWQHIQSNNAVVMISAFRKERSLEKNTALSKVLATQIREAGFGYFWADAVSIENRGTPDETHASEVSIFIIGDETDRLRDLAIAWGKAYQQDEIAYKAPGEKMNFEILWTKDGSGKLMVTLKNVKYDRLGDIYTRLRRGKRDPIGRSFVLEGFRSPMSPLGKLRAKTIGISLDDHCL